MNVPFILFCRMKISWVKWFNSVLSCPNSWFLHRTPFRAKILQTILSQNMDGGTKMYLTSL
jgi:hypothetical protein